MIKLGYQCYTGSNSKTIKKRLEKFNIPTDHFKLQKPTKRNEENVFCTNSTARQSTLRKWFKKISSDEKCAICGQSKVWNGKELVMILDHIDGNNTNNIKENLRWICPNCGTQLDTFTGRNRVKRQITSDRDKASKASKVSLPKTESKKKLCPICKTNYVSNTTVAMCMECYKKDKRKRIPPKNVLLELLLNFPMTTIGSMYGVSDKAVRKWCISYGLPYKLNDIKKAKALYCNG